MDDPALPTQEQVDAERKKKTRLGVSVLCLVLGVALLGNPISAAALAVGAVLWWGRPFGMAFMFLLAMTVAAWANAKPPAPAGDSLDRWIGKKDEVAAMAAASGRAGGAPPAEPVRPPPAPVAQTGYRVIEVKDGGTIRGFVRISEAKPVWTLIHWRDQKRGCGEEHPTERMIYGEDLALGNALVYLEAIPAGKDWPEPMRSDDRTATIDQKGCRYAPHVQWVRTDTQMVVTNSDLAEHNIHGYRRTVADTQFNFGSPPGVVKGNVGGAVLVDALDYFVKCDIHPWMNAYVFAVRHPYHDVTSATATSTRKAGEFVLENVPAGTYRLVCWHEGMVETTIGGSREHYDSVTYSDAFTTTQSVTVKAGETTTVPAFTVPAPP